MKHRVEYGAIALVTAAVRLMPWALVRLSGKLLGLMFYGFDGTHRRITLANLRRPSPRAGRTSAGPSRAACSRTSAGCSWSC